MTAQGRRPGAPTPGALLIVGPYPPYRGGIAQFTGKLHEAVAAAGRRVVGVSFSRQYPSFLFPGTSQEIPREAGDSDGEGPSGSSAHRLLDSLHPWTGRRVGRIAAAEGVTEAVFMVWMPFFAPVYLSAVKSLKARGIRCTALVHNAIPHEKQPFGSLLMRRLLTRMDRIVALSESVAKDIRSLAPGVARGNSGGAPGGVEVRAHPVYDQFGETLPLADARRQLGLALPDGAFVLLFFGLIRAYKGLDVLIDALAGLPNHVHLLVAGEFYEDEQAYRDQVSRLGLADRVHIHAGYVPDADVRVFFSAADVVVQPYRHATQSGVVQTAFQFGRPVVVTRVGGLPDMVRDGVDGVVVAPDDPAALTAGLERVIDARVFPVLQNGADAARILATWPDFARLFVS